MAIVEMSRLTLLGLESERDKIIDSLMKMGVIEINSLDLDNAGYGQFAERIDSSRKETELEEEISQVLSAITALNRYAPVKKGLFEGRKNITYSQFQKIISNKTSLWEKVRRVRECEKIIASCVTEENRLKNLIGSLMPWEPLDVRLEINSTKCTVTSFGVLPAAVELEDVYKSLSKNAPLSETVHVLSDKDQHYLFIISHKSMQKETFDVLKSFGWSDVSFKGLIGSAKENIADLTEKKKQVCREREHALENMKSLTEFKEDIEILYDYLIIQRDKIKALNKMATTGRTFVLNGWIPVNLENSVKENIENQYHCSVHLEKPKDGEEFPVLLMNNAFAESVEDITNMYSVPSSREIDPNSIMAPFFILFFGLMLSDGGYGLVMTLFAAFMLLKFTLEEGMRKFMRLLLFCGISTMFWGALFGGWFGISAFTKYALWFDVAKNPGEMLKWSIFFGIFHMYVGLGVRAANLIRYKRYADVFYDVVVFYIFFTGFVLFTLPYMPGIEKDKVFNLVDMGKKLLLAGALLLVLTQGRGKKGIISRIVSGVSSLYGLVGFMSDMLSYSRLLALGLATSVIASIVNEISVRGGLNNIVKILMFVVIIVVGHLFNFAINALGAYVHSSRLQYIEFFGKFYKGGGTAFKPLRVNTKYFIIK